jgi:hypothetical protein
VLGWYGLGKDGRWLLVEGAVGPLGIVILLPRLNDLACVRATEEPVPIETLVAELAVETLQLAVLRRLAGLNEVKGDVLGVRPGVEDLTGAFRPLIDCDLLGSTRARQQLVEHAHHPRPGQGGRLDLDGQTLPRRRVQDIACAEASSLDQHILQASNPSPMPPRASRGSS